MKEKIYFISFIIFALASSVFLFLFLKKDGYRFSENYASEEAPDSPFPMPPVRVPSFPKRVCDIKKYGAIEGGEKNNTQAIKKAIESCSQRGGGVVIVPEGKWLNGPIHLKSNINLHLDEKAEIVFSPDRNEYLPAVFTRFQGMELYNFSPLVYCKDCENVAITGKGKLIGNGEAWESWSANTGSDDRDKLYEMSIEGVSAEKRIFGTENCGLRPSFVQFINSKNILLEDFKIINGPMWTIHPVYSENIIIQKLNIETYSSNTDGIVVDSSKNVYIKDTDFSTGDDSIAIKSGLEEDGIGVGRLSENIVIENCRFSKGHGILAIGSELSGGIRNILFENSTASENDNGIRMKTTDSRGGFVENIWINNINMPRINGEAVVIVANYKSKLKSKAERNTAFKNIHVKNIQAEIIGDFNSINIDMDDDNKMEDISLEDVSLKSDNGMYFNNAKNTVLNNIKLDIKNSAPSLELKNCQNIKVSRFECSAKNKACIKIKGPDTRNINLMDNSFGKNAVFIEKPAENSVLTK